MKRIVFIGAAGCGKSTCASEIFTILKKNNLNAEMIMEWIRYDIQSNGPMENIWEQYRTLQYQRELEDSVPSNVEYVITDSGTLTPYFYTCLYAKRLNSRERLVLQDMHRYLLNDIYLKRYWKIFYFPLNLTYQQNPNILSDGTRYQTSDELQILDDHMDMVLNKLYNMGNVYKITSSLEERVNMVLNIIKED